MKRAMAMIVVLAALAGCSKGGGFSQFEPDQQRRGELFQACLKNLPAGPSSTRYNDWDEVVDSCESAAYYQSLVCISGPCLKAADRRSPAPIDAPKQS